MNLYLVGTIVNIMLLVGAGAAFAIGCTAYKREKSAGMIRLYLLVCPLAAFVWAFCFATLGFSGNIDRARIFRTIGLIGIDIFLMTDFSIVVELSGVKRSVKHCLMFAGFVMFIADFIIFARPNVDEMYIKDGFVTWVGNRCGERDFHQAVILITFVTMAILGFLAYKHYRLKRQKRFLVVFYVANLIFVALSTVDTFHILKYPLPTSGLGAIVCTLILCMGAQKNNAFGFSLADVFDRIYEFVNDGILIFDENRKIVFANPYCVTLLESTDYIGKEIADIFEVDSANVNHYFTGAQRGNMGGLRLTIKSTRIKCSSRLACVKDKYDEPCCYIMSINDITKEMNMLDELKEANEAKSHFLASVSHEIKTPINAVLGMNEMIKRASSDTNIQSYSMNIERSSRQLLSIINDILDLTKIESGKLELYNSSYDLASLFNDMYCVNSRRAMEKGIEMSFEVNPDTPSWLYGDEVRINQIISNLVNNAIKYTDEGFVELRCDYENVDNDNVNLIVSVRDSGRGIQNVKNSNLFESFTRLDEKHNQTIVGTGLGLAITRLLLDMMGGSIDVESIYGVGSRFTVVIPQRISNRNPVGPVSSRICDSKNNEVYHESFTAPDAHILIVDDVEMNLMVVEELLKPTKMCVDCVMSGEDALRRCRDTKYDIILMDHMMPNMDGIECLKKIRCDCSINSSTPVIVLTANAVVGVRDMYLREGFNDYLSKPIEYDKLESMIIKYLPEGLVNIMQ